MMWILERDGKIQERSHEEEKRNPITRLFCVCLFPFVGHPCRTDGRIYLPARFSDDLFGFSACPLKRQAFRLIVWDPPLRDPPGLGKVF